MAAPLRIAFVLAILAVMACANTEEIPEVVSIEQFDAPKDPNHLLRFITEKLYNRIYDVVQVNIDYGGEALNGKIGVHNISAKIIRQFDNAEISIEYKTILYTITDTDECARDLHDCHPSATCLNNIGSYDCICTGESFCPYGRLCASETTSAECCQFVCADEGFNSKQKCLENCRRDFSCTSDPCDHDLCGMHATCISEGKSYRCECNEGYAGDGIKCTEVVDDLCQRNTCPGNCRCEPDSKSKSYSCVAQVGYVAVNNPFNPNDLPDDHVQRGGHRMDNNLCFHDNGTDLQLEGENPLIVYQGDEYKEHGLKITDKQDENFLRHVEISYSRPMGQYFRKPGEINVTYTILTPWLKKPEIARVRTVIVKEVDPCHYSGQVAEFRHNCSADAICTHKNKDSLANYECVCPPGYDGDGMDESVGGSGCRDSVCPELTCVGQGCKIMKFKAASLKGIVSVGRQHELRWMEETDLSYITSKLNEWKDQLCTTSSPCFKAQDWTPQGYKDITDKVKLLPLIRSRKQWEFYMPYTVEDDAGNRAEGDHNLTLQVEIIDVNQYLCESEGLLTLNTYTQLIPAHWPLLGISGVLILLLFIPILTTVVWYLKCGIFALQAVMFPRSLVKSREDFELGMDYALLVMSLGMMPRHTRQRIIATKWIEVLDSVEG